MRAVILLTALAFAGPANAAELFQGNCHMNECTWFSIEDRDLVGTTADGALFKVTTKSWVSEHPDGNYEKHRKRTGGEVSTDYFFCSKTKPAAMSEDDNGGWTVNFLAPGSSLSSDAWEEVTRQYFAVCHGMAPDDDIVEQAKKFGYPPIDIPPEATTLKKPQDFLKQS